MAKKALCIGINDYPYEGSDLNGCVNDSTAWAKLLTEHYDFPRPDVKMIKDSEATKANVLTALGDLLAGAREGDVLVFMNASHGSYIADTSGDEEMYDEILCPYDVADNVLVDDELRELIANLQTGVSLTVISDSCFSGTVTRAAIMDNLPWLRVPDDRRLRFLNPALRGDPVLRNPWKAKPKGRDKYPESKMKEILLSGCSDKEYSHDALIGGVYHGAMTFHALQAIREADYQITYAQLETRLNILLEEAGFPQHPQLEGMFNNKKKQVFT